MRTLRLLSYLAFLFSLLSCNQEKKAEPGLYLNEFLSSNSSYGFDPLNYAASDWIEIYNAYDHPLDLGAYFLSDNPNNLYKWSFPPGSSIEPNGYLIVWADGLDSLTHCNFRLSKAGGDVILSSKDSLEIDRINYRSQALNVSMGRKWDGVDEWVYFDFPNPSQSNSKFQSVDNIEFSEEPEFSLSAGFYDSGMELELSDNYFNTEIRYTTNGDIPTRNSLLFDDKILIDSTMVIRAVSVKKGKLKSKTITNTYFIAVDKALPVFSIVSDSIALWDDSSGIYERSFRGIPRMANVEFFEDKEGLINQEIDISISGNVARNHGQKAMVLDAKSRYGKGIMEYRFFPNKRVYQHQSILLRAGGHPDKYKTMFIDGFGGRITESHMNLDHAAIRPTVLYLNGKYWGMYNIREKVNNNFLMDNHRIAKNKYDFLQNSWAIERNGSKREYFKTKKFLRFCDKSDPENYKKVRESYDIDNFINYMIIEMFAANRDWPSWNIKFWKEKEENEKWKWILIDLDFGFGIGTKAEFNMMEYASSPVQTRSTNPPGSTQIFRSLLEFSEFRTDFIQRFAVSLNEIYNAERLDSVLLAFKNQRLKEMPFEIDRWSYFVYESPWGNCKIPNDIERWYERVDNVRKFVEQRPDYVRKHLKEYFSIKGEVKVETIAREGKIYINTIRIDDSLRSGIYFKGIEMKLKASPDPGYLLDYWLVNGKKMNEKELSHLPEEGDKIAAIFKQISTSILPCIIEEDLTLSKANSPYYVVCDLLIKKGYKLIIEEGVELYMNQYKSIVVNGGLSIVGSATNPVNILPNPENDTKEWGALCIENAESKVELTHVNLIKSSWYEGKLKFKSSITSIHSDLSLDHVKVESSDFPFYSEYGNIRIKNSTLTSPKTCDMINIKYAESALVEGCVLPGNDYPNTDAIDFDSIQNGTIRNNIIYGFSGYNSDAIDIGEACSDILIEENKIFNISDKGISIGQHSSAIIQNNLLYGCQMGVGIKDKNSIADISYCTFVANKIGVAAFEKNEYYGGGTAEISHCIFYASKKSSVYADAESEITVNYSLSDQEELIGKGNSFGEAKFKDAVALDFRLKEPLQSDKQNIGYAISIKQEAIAAVCISDIRFDFKDGAKSFVSVELSNTSDMDIDLTHYTLVNDNNNSFTLPYGFVLKAGENCVLSNDVEAYNSNHIKPHTARECISKKLISKGNLIRLYNGRMNLLDEAPILEPNPISLTP